MARAFTTSEEEAASLLALAGLSRLGARCLVALLRGGAWNALDVAHAAAVARQEVSVGMRELEARELIAIEREPREAGGRPLNRYRLAAPDALARIVHERRRALEDEMQALGRIERMAARR